VALGLPFLLLPPSPEYWRHYPSATLPRASLRREEKERVAREPQTDRQTDTAIPLAGPEDRRKQQAVQHWAKDQERGYRVGTSI